MRSLPWSRLGWFVVIWAVVVGLAALMFLSREFDGDSPTVTIDVPMAQSRLTMMRTPGPWNGGQAWSQERVDARIADAYRVFWPEAWHDAIPYVILAAAVLVGGLAWIILASRRQARAVPIAEETR